MLATRTYGSRGYEQRSGRAPDRFGAKEIADGRAVVRLAAGRHRANPLGTLHGGILCDIADAAMGMVFASTLAPGESFTARSSSRSSI